MSTLQNGDSFLVQRTDPQSGISTNYQVSQENLMANLADDDLLLVQRTSAGISTNYSITGSALKQDLGGVSGLIIPDVEVLTPINGAGITEFDRYVPISSAITAVGEAGTITKETDAIQSVADVGSGSVLFNDSDDYLTLSTNSDFKFGTSDFTIECFVKPETLNTNAYSSYFSTILDFDGGTGNYAGAWFAIHQNHTQVFWASDNANQLGGGQLTLDWNHIAVTRSSGTTSLYVNGSWVVSHTDNNNYTDSETRGLYIGTQNGTDRRFGGSISNLRIVKGTALYTGTGNFTPPTSSLGAVNNTKLLCCQSTTSVTEAAVSPGTITTGGSPTVGVGPVSSKLLSFPTNTNFSALSVGDIVQGGGVIAAIDGAATPPTISVGGGTWTTGDRLTSQVSYEKSLTFTDPAELDNMVAPLEMTDANGDVVTAVSDTITNVNGNVLTLQSNTNLAYFQPGDEVQTGVQVVSVDTYAPSITVDGGNWKGADGSGSVYEIPKSLRFDSLYTGSDNSKKNYLSRTPTSQGNRKTFTWSGWVKRSLSGGSYQAIFTAGTSGFIEGLWFGSTEEIYVSFYEDGGTTRNLYSEAKFRDYANWQHIVLSVDTTQSTSTDRVKLYVNGVQQTFTGNSSFPSHYAETRYINNTISHFIGANPNFNYPFGGYLADVHFIDGQVIAPTVFGGFDSNDVWQPNPASISSYGVNGFHLFFDDSSNTTIGYDTAGSNNWGATNISVSGADNDRLADSPTSNYVTLNPLFDGQNGSEFSNGNLTYSHNQGVALGTIPFGKTGKWYFEVEMIGDNAGIGVALSEAPSHQYLGYDSNSWTYYSNMNYTPGGKYTNYTSHGTVTPYGSGYTTGDVIGVAFDSDAGELSFYKNGASQGVAFTGFNDGKDYFPAVGSGSVNVNLNFGQRPFAYPAPSGYKAINLANMPEPTIKNGSQHFDTVTYTGNGSTKTISGLEFSPDLIWVRYRGHGISHILYDTVRGLGPLKGMNPDLTRAEGACHDKQSGTGFGYVSAAHSDGFTVVNGDQSNGYVNYSGHEYVAWCWNAGDTTVTNNNGSISSQVRANPEAGFSIVSYAGSQSTGTYTIGHGLNKQPEFIITKARNDGGNDWGVYYAANGVNTNWMSLNRTNQEGANSNGEMGGAWVAANSSTIEIDQLAFANVASSMIAYCFAPVEGYSSMGSYIGNGSTEQGPFVYTGFKPAWIIIKCSSDSGNAHWVIFDSERDGFNPVSKTISANGNDQEYGYSDGVVGVDFLSNGFTLRDNNSSRNGASQTYIYMAFAENPTKTTGGTSGSGDTQVTFNLASTATDVLEVDGTTMYLNGATGPWRTGLHIEGSEVNATPPGPSEITFTSQNQGTPAFSGVDATLASRTWTLESGTAATGPWTLVDTYSDFGVLNTQTGATPWTENKPTLQPNTYYRIKVKYNSTNAESVESVYNTFKTGPNS